MPYHVIKYNGGYVVANQHTGKHYSKHALTKENAEEQMKAMYNAMRPRDIVAEMNPHLLRKGGKL
jgi:hypothetical protein